MVHAVLRTEVVTALRCLCVAVAPRQAVLPVVAVEWSATDSVVCSHPIVLVHLLPCPPHTPQPQVNSLIPLPQIPPLQVAYFITCRFLKTSTFHPRVFHGNKIIFISVPVTIAIMVRIEVATVVVTVTAFTAALLKAAVVQRLSPAPTGLGWWLCMDLQQQCLRQQASRTAQGCGS